MRLFCESENPNVYLSSINNIWRKIVQTSNYPSPRYFWEGMWCMLGFWCHRWGPTQCLSGFPRDPISFTWVRSLPFRIMTGWRCNLWQEVFFCVLPSSMLRFGPKFCQTFIDMKQMDGRQYTFRGDETPTLRKKELGGSLLMGWPRYHSFRSKSNDKCYISGKSFDYC